MAFMQCLAIQTADPRSVCWAGGNLEGEVTLVLTDPTLIRGIRLSYRCEAHIDYMDDGQEVEVDDDDEEQEEGSAKRGHRRQKKTRFMDSVAVTPKRRTATEKFLETTSILWGTEPSTSYGEVMPAGHHALAFDIRVPQQLPGSFEGRYGFVRHWLECVVDRPGAPEMATKRALSVISHCDLNKDPVALKSIRHREDVILCCGCVRPDRYDVSYELPYRGYVPGETMFPDLRIRNFTRNPIHVSVRLQMVEFSSHGVGWQGLAFQDEVKVGTIPLKNVAKVRQSQLSSSQSLTTNSGVLLGPAPPNALANNAANHVGVPALNRASSSSTGEGRVTSDADSASPLARLGGAARRDHRGVRSPSIISTNSHWSFNPMMAPRPLHHGFPWKFLTSGNSQKPKKVVDSKQPTVYRC